MASQRNPKELPGTPQGVQKEAYIHKSSRSTAPAAVMLPGRGLHDPRHMTNDTSRELWGTGTGVACPVTLPHAPDVHYVHLPHSVGHA